MIRGVARLNQHENRGKLAISPLPEFIKPPSMTVMNRATRGKAISGMLNTWEKKISSGFRTRASQRRSRFLGQGANGYVTRLPANLVRAIQRHPTAFGIHGWVRGGSIAPTRGTLAAKFQLLSNRREAQVAMGEAVVHAIAHKDRVSSAPGIPGLARYVPAFYGSGFIPARGMHVIFMPIVRGVPLSRYLDKGKISARLQGELERALAAMWHRGFTHGDAHDENFIVQKGGKVTIVDFGLSLPLPASLRPASLTQARSKAFLDKLTAYTARERKAAGYAWFNPNARLLSVTRRHVTRRRVARP